jgi:predicted P-loop ATPase
MTTRDMQIRVATGRHRRETQWKNKTITWGKFLDRLAQPRAATHTMAEYLLLPKDQQATIKDVGAFVGGYLTAGRRKPENVAERWLITLDQDLPTKGQAEAWDDWCMLYGYAAARYSTFKHSPDAPRYRWVILLDRAVARDEYEPLARRVAEWIGIEGFDPTTYQAERLMYWPAHPSDSTPELVTCDGEPLPVDQVLSTYRDWRDVSEWPAASSESEVKVRELKRLGDPREKPGIVGAFCRTYSITEAIETFIPERYIPSDVDNRWTFIDGSTAAGLVVYDDTWAYSHHSTDPACGHAHNAFDLVRVHLYGAQDDRCNAETPITKRPSYLAMEALCAADKGVRRTISEEKMAEVRGEFSVDASGDLSVEAAEPSEEDLAWMEDLDRNKKTLVCEPTSYNIELILTKDVKLAGKFGHNFFDGRNYVLGVLPWKRRGDLGSQWQDYDDAGLRAYLETVYGIYHREKIRDTLLHQMRRNGFHPVKEYLQGLTWDGTPRVDTLLIDYMGAEDSSYVRAVARKFMAAAVARVMEPGCKFDHVPVLTGRQGVGKSTLARKLGRSWFKDTFHAVQGKESIEQLHGVWIMEMGELAGLKKVEVEAIKAFISRQTDSYRRPYETATLDLPRQCVFIGTTNQPDFLRDQTGNRRFWPVSVEPDMALYSVHTDLGEEVVDQLWAEAVQIWKGGERLYMDERLEKQALQVQEEHLEEDPWQEMIESYLNMKVPQNWDEMSRYERIAWVKGGVVTEAAEGLKEITETSLAEIWNDVFEGDLRDLRVQTNRTLKVIMERIKGWKWTGNRKRLKEFGRVRLWEKEG